MELAAPFGAGHGAGGFIWSCKWSGSIIIWNSESSWRFCGPAHGASPDAMLSQPPDTWSVGRELEVCTLDNPGPRPSNLMLISPPENTQPILTRPGKIVCLPQSLNCINRNELCCTPKSQVLGSCSCHLNFQLFAVPFPVPAPFGALKKFFPSCKRQ
jgi:hypothetical protein